MGELTTKEPGFWARTWAKLTGKGLPTTSLTDEDSYLEPSSVDGLVVTPAYDPNTALSAYGAFPWVRACVTAKAEDLAALPRYVMVGQGEDAERFDNHPVLELLANPNPRVSGVVFTRQRLVDLFLSGNAMRAVAGVNLGEPVSLHRLHPDLWDPEIDGKGGIESWQGESASNSFPADQVMHDRYPSWVNDARKVLGESPIRSLDRDLTTDLNAAKLAAKLSATGQPRMMLTPDPKDPKSARGMDAETKRKQRAGWERALDQSKSGTVIGDSGWVVTPFGLTPRDMEFEKTRIWVRDATIAALGCVPSRVGLPTANYATSREQMKVYWTTLQGEAAVLDATDSQLARKFTRWAQANLGGSWRQKLKTLRVVTDFSAVEALQESRSERLARVERHWMMGVPLASAYLAEGFDELAQQVSAAPAKPAEPQVEGDAEQQEAERRLAANGKPRLTMFSRSRPTLVVRNGPERYSHINFTPPEGVQQECARGIDWHEDGESGDGLKPATVAWARRLSEGEDITPDKARKMRAWLARHESDKEGEGFSPGEPGYPSPGRVAWALWGGDPAVGWSNKLVEQMDAADEEKRTNQWHDYIERAHTPIERLLLHAMREALQEQARVLASRVPELLAEVERGLYTKQLTEDEVAAVLRIAESMGILRDAAMESIRKALERGLQEALKDLRIDVPTDVQRLQRLLDARLGLMVQNVSPETRRVVRQVVVTGLDQGLTTNEIQAALMQSAGFSPSRALRIARTETTTALEEGADVGYDAATNAGVKFELMWLTARDGSPPIRASHLPMDGQVRKPGETFVSGAGHNTLSPGGFGIAAEDCNCRCTRVPKIIEEQ